MRCLERNKVSFWYCLYDKKVPVLDKNGDETGESRIVYHEAVEHRGNVSKAYGEAQVEQFGSSSDYDKVIVVEEPDLPIDENTVLFVDSEPQYDSAGNPLYDYTVKRVAPTRFSGCSYWITKVR